MYQGELPFQIVTPIHKKVLECLDSHLKPIMQQDFITTIKRIENILQNTTLVTADVVGLYSS